MPMMNGKKKHMMAKKEMAKMMAEKKGKKGKKGGYSFGNY